MFGKLEKKLRDIPLAVKVSSSYAICSILQRCLSFITLPLFTRLLTTDQYGEYTIYSSWSGILTIFITLNLAYGSFSTAMVKFENRRTQYISSIEGICLLLAGIFLLIYIPFKRLWNRLFELPTFLIVIMVAEIITQTSIQLWSGKKRFEFRYRSVITVTLLISIMSPIIAYIFVINFHERGFARILGYSLTTIIFGGCILALNITKGKTLYNKEFWKYAFGFNIPLLTYYLSQLIFNQSDRIMISHITGTSDAAMYGVAYNLAMILTFILNALNNAYVPWLYGKIKKDEQEKNKPVVCVIAVLMSLMILCVIWYAPEIILLMAGSHYTEAVWVVAPVSMSLLLLFYTQLFINIEFYYEEKQLLVWASVGAAILNIVLNALTIPRIGFVAAGYTTLTSYVVFAISNYVAMKKALKKRGIIDNLYNYKALLLILTVFILSGFLGVGLYHYLIPRIVITVIVLLILILFRKTLKLNLSEIRNSKENKYG